MPVPVAKGASTLGELSLCLARLPSPPPSLSPFLSSIAPSSLHSFPSSFYLSPRPFPLSCPPFSLT
jgi:hypothetical protein